MLKTYPCLIWKLFFLMLIIFSIRSYQNCRWWTIGYKIPLDHGPSLAQHGSQFVLQGDCFPQTHLLHMMSTIRQIPRQLDQLCDQVP